MSTRTTNASWPSSTKENVTTMHVLLYGREMSSARLRIWQQNRAASSNLNIIPYGPSSSMCKGDILVIHRKFARQQDVPEEVADAVQNALGKGMTIVTDEGMQRHLLGGGLGGDITERMERLLDDSKKQSKHCKKQSKQSEKCHHRRVSVSPATIGGTDVIDLVDDEDEVEEQVVIIDVDDDDEGGQQEDTNVIVLLDDSDDDCRSVKMPSRPPTTFKPRKRPRGRPHRNIHKFQKFHASWLRGLNNEAKVKARTCQDDAIQTEQRRRVLTAVQTLQAQRTARGERHKYAFEECYDRSTQQQRGVVLEEEDAKRWERNKPIANRLRAILSAELALAELERIRTESSSSTTAEEKKRKEVHKSQQSYRQLQYERVARIVEQYPIPVTCSCLAPPEGGYGKRKGVGRPPTTSITEALASSASVGDTQHPKIECGGSTRLRLLRSILQADDHPSLHLDDGHVSDERLLSNPEVKAVEELRQIWGVGMTTASKMVSWGVPSISQLRQDTQVLQALNEQQRVGLARYEDLRERIPRCEVGELEEFVRSAVDELTGGRVTVTACGSYRRGADSCGDVDLILLPNRECGAHDNAATKAMPAVLDELRRRKFLTDDLTTPNMFGENDGDNPGTDALSYMGVCRLPDGEDRVHRRVDIKAYPGCQGAFALLYFTGDAHFNRSLRSFAKRAGLTLTDAGLACCDRSRVAGKVVKTRVYDSVAAETEEDVFKAMGFGYVPPEDRCCGGNHGKVGKNCGNSRRWDERRQHGDDADSDDAG